MLFYYSYVRGWIIQLLTNRVKFLTYCSQYFHSSAYETLSFVARPLKSEAVEIKSSKIRSDAFAHG